MNRMLHFFANTQQGMVNVLRISIFIVMVWIGGLKAFQYEADGIVPFVANSPLMSFFYHKQAPEYKQHMNKEGEYKPENVAWHQENGTYLFSYGLGTAIVLIGTLVLFGIFNPKIGLIGGILTAGMALVTVSFLITTPETFVGNLGGPDFGFPYLSGAGRLVIKDVIMFAGALVIVSDCARRILKSEKV